MAPGHLEPPDAARSQDGFVLEGGQPYNIQHLDFKPVIMILDF